MEQNSLDWAAGYEQGYADALAFVAAQKGMRLAKRAQRTSVSAVRATLPRSGTRLERIYSLICEAGQHGMTDFEIEAATGMAHQSASAARNVLMNRGLIMDAGVTRKNARGMDAIVWIKARPASKEPDDRYSGSSVHVSDRPDVHVWTWRDSTSSVQDCRERGAARSAADEGERP